MWEENEELEQAFANAHRGMEETVRFFRLLRDCNVTFVLPYHPEMVGEKIIGSDGKMTITIWRVDNENVIPIFTSPARLEEAMRSKAGPGERYASGQMIGRELFRAFCAPHNAFRVAINPGCACGTHFLDLKRIQGIVDGSELEIPTPGELAMNGLCISLPQRQPESLKTPLTKFFDGIPEVKAAWLFYEEEPKAPFEKIFVLGLALAGGEAEEIRREAELAIAAVCPPEWGSRVIIMDPKDPGFIDILNCPSFYRMADYVPPLKSKPEDLQP